MATTVVPWVISWGWSPRGMSAHAGGLPARLRPSTNEGPGSSPAEKYGRVIADGGYRVATRPQSRHEQAAERHPKRQKRLPAPAGTRASRPRRMGPSGPHGIWRLLATLLHVRLHEVLGIRLEDLVDLVQQVVELGLDLLALLRGGGCLLDDLFLTNWGACLALLLSFSHVPRHLPIGPASLAQPVQQLSDTAAFGHQLTHVCFGSTCRIHHRHPPQRVATDVEHHGIPVGSHDLRRPALQALAPEVCPRVGGAARYRPV